MLDKISYSLFIVLIPVVTVMTFRNIRNYARDDETRQNYAEVKKVLPVNENKRLMMTVTGIVVLKAVMTVSVLWLMARRIMLVR